MIEPVFGTPTASAGPGRQLQAALFNRAPAIGEQNPAGEVSYAGYRRVHVTERDGVVPTITFRVSEDDREVLVTHIVLLDAAQVVVHVLEATPDMLVVLPSRKRRLRVSELEGADLDAAVVLATGGSHVTTCPDGVPQNVRDQWPAEGVWLLKDGPNAFYTRVPPAYSTRWEFGGPLIERERIALTSFANGEWEALAIGPAAFFDRIDDGRLRGQTPLIAAMRALVVAKFGDQVKLP